TGMALAGPHRWCVAFHSHSDRTPCPASFGSRNCSRCLRHRNEDSKFTRRWVVISKCVGLTDLKNYKFRSRPVESSLDATLCQDSTDLFHGLLRSNVVDADKKNNAVDKLERVIQHQALHLSVIDSTPMGTGQKCPTDLKLGLIRPIPVVAGRADNLGCLSIHCYQSTTRLQRLLKVLSKALLLITISCRMNFPNEWVRRDCV